MANRWLEEGRVLLKDDLNNKNLDWSERMNIAVEKINKINPLIIYDFGCGDCKIKNQINHGIEYYGFDSIRHADDVSILDLNENFPEIRPYSGLGLFLGIFEYIDDFEKILKYISDNFNYFIFSCRDRDFYIYREKIEKYYGIELLKKSIKYPPKQSVYFCNKK